MTPEKRQLVAYHEAGHLAAAWILGLHTGFASINDPLPDAHGVVHFDTDHLTVDNRDVYTRMMIQRHLVAAFLGYMAGKCHLPDGRCNYEWPPPYERAHDEELERVGLMVSIWELTEAEYDHCVMWARAILERPGFKALVDRFAQTLLEGSGELDRMGIALAGDPDLARVWRDAQNPN